MFFRYDFHRPYLKSVLQSPVEVQTMKLLFSPLKSVWYSLANPERGCYIHVSVLIYCFDYFRIMFLPSGVKPWNRILFPQLVLTFLWNFHLGCDLAEYWLYPSWFCLVVPNVIRLFCQHIHDNIHTYMIYSLIKIHFSFAFINILLAYYHILQSYVTLSPIECRL